MAQSVTKQIDKQINNPLKTSYIGNVEFKDYSKLQEQELKKIRIQQVRQQEAEKTRKNLKTKKELEEQQKQEEYMNQQFLIYQQKLQLQQKLLEEAEKQKKEIGESHRQALEAEKQRLKDIEEQKLREEQFQKNQKIRTQQAADWAKKEQEKLDYKKSFNKQRIEMLEEIQEKERQEAQNYQNYINNLPEPVQEDPLQYDAYEKQDNKKSYYNNIDFTKTYFHNPVVIKHEDDNLIENALENAKKEYEKTQIKNLELLQTKKLRKQEEEERGRAALKMTQNERVLREFSQEMDKKKAELEQDRIKQTANNPNHSEKPVTHFQKDIQKKAVVEKAFEKEFFGERAEWTHEEINDKERDIHAKKQSTTLKKSQSLQNVDPKEFEKRAVENAQKKSKNVKIFRKPPLDTNVFQDKSKNKKNASNSQEQREDEQDKQHEKNQTEESQKNLQQSAGKNSSISNNLARSMSDQNKEQIDPNILTQSQNQDNKFRNSYDSYDMSDRKVSQVTSDRKKKIRFVSPQKSNSDSDFTDEENTFGQRSGSKDNNVRYNNFVNKQNDQNNTFSPYNSNGFSEKDQQSLKNSSQQKSLQFNKQGSNFNNTGAYTASGSNQSSQKEQNLNRNDIKQYILEQEQYLKKLEDTRKNSRERIRQEENALLSTLNQATTTMDNKNRQNDLIQQQQQAKNFNLSSVSIPEKKAIFIEENSSHNSSQIISHSQNHYGTNNQYNNSNGQKRQVVYSSNPEKTKKANQMLDQFLNSNSIQNQSYNNYDSFNQRSLNEDYDERENLDYVEDTVKSSFKQTYNKESQMSQGKNSQNKMNPFIKPDNFLGSSGYESQSRDFSDSKNDFTESINDASNSKNIRNDIRNNHYQSDFTESQLTSSINNNNNNYNNESSINQQQINSSVKNSYKGSKNQENLLATFSPSKDVYKQDQQYRNYEEEEEKGYKFGNTTESKYKNDSFKKYSGLSNNSNLHNNPSNISESRKLGLSQSKGPNNNSKDLIELTDSLLTSNNFNSINKNNSSHLRQNNFNSSQNFQNHSSEHYNKRSELSPSSELSYSLSEIDKSADKFRRVEYIPQNSTTQKRNLSNENNQFENNQDSQSRIGTAKFGQPLINQNKSGISQNLNSRDSQKGIQMDIQFREDEEDEETYKLDSQNKSENATRGEGQASLADLFKKKKADLAKKYELEQQQRAQRSDTQEPKKERTKEDILKQRKEMMKRPDFLKNKNSTSQEESSINDQYNSQKSEQRGYMTSFHDPSKKVKEPPQELMDRLANGTKVKVDKKEYLKLTNKNYEMLPEVKKRKEEEQKKEEYRRRQESVKKLQQNIKESQKLKKN
ncbi:hypothetical protein TTHERM_00046590 (macronuclear) [Tetrahymena thermophila SB210]|uniref:Uncharacterized protein n=1 Tax=Tetrahymena thermophila (strain SB210) TaxID=312017 RepID=Q23DN2_TETTS|nr:hypothetical protein TTHERM_00046590 [Tetrahymena thermophila SB210]EAR94554.2 hypothetical protein TTHERM_00046590 [Tetrahymena thermophila SB210]|eukprot:XP_001014654.2 hypothetical protein TTHERM_00046590 [Tetrahymena thermophila SB210]